MRARTPGRRELRVAAHGGQPRPSRAPAAPDGGTRIRAPFVDYGRRRRVLGDRRRRVSRPGASLRGHYLYADFCTDTITAVQPGIGRRTTHRAPSGIVHFGAAAGGSVLVASVTEGKLYRIDAA